MRNAKLGVLVLGVIGVAACSAPEETRQANERRDAVGGWTVERNEKLGTPAFVAPAQGSGPRVLAPNVEADVATVGFLDTHKALLGMRAPKQELRATKTNVDALSMTHVRLQQVERGVPVTGAEVLAHYDAMGRVTSLQQQYVPGLETLDLTPAIEKDVASTIAMSDARSLVPTSAVLALVGAPELVIIASDGAKPALAWRVDVAGGVRHGWQLSIDANTGAVLDRIDQIEEIVGSGTDLGGETRTLNYATDTKSQNVLADVTRPVRIITRDSTGTKALAAPPFTSADGASWDTASVIAPGAAVDAHSNMGAVTDYFAKTFERKGWDDKNGDMNVLVHFEDEDGTGLDNAFFSRTSNVIAFGDGKTKFKPLAQAIDIIAHEYTHAVIGTSSNLVYKDQSGALNESIADVFGAIIEHAVRPDPINNWLLGEGSLKDSPAALRDLGAPDKGTSKQPKHMKEFIQTKVDNGGVHVNSGIPNQAAFLATMGGTNTVSNVTVTGGIGWDNLAKVWYRANTVYLTTTSDFAAMAKATLLAAADLKLAQADVDALDCAWKAVGVTQGACATPPPPAAPADDADKANKEEAPTPAGAAPSSTIPDEAGDVQEVTIADADEQEATSSTPKKASLKTAETAETEAPATLGCSSTGHRIEAPWGALLGLFGVAAVLRRRARK